MMECIQCLDKCCNQSRLKIQNLEIGLHAQKLLLDKAVEVIEYYANEDGVIKGFDKASGSRYVKSLYHDPAKDFLKSLTDPSAKKTEEGR